MQRYKPFSGDKPTLEDLQFNQDGLEAAILNRQAEMFSDGVVSGLEVKTNDDAYLLQPGIAFIQGERIEVKAEKDLGLAPESITLHICLRHATTTAHPKQHFVTGEVTDVWVEDGWQVTTYEDGATIPAGDLLLADLLKDGSLVDHRTFVQVQTDPRIHAPNTDTHTTAPAFRVGGPSGAPALTTANLLTVSDILADLFLRGVIDLQDGNGEREILTRKIPSKPHAPEFSRDNLQVVVDDPSDRSRTIRLALDTYTRKQITAQTLATQITLLDELRVQVVARQTQGYSLDQIRGDAVVGDAPDLEVRRLKNRLIVAGALSVKREAGTLELSNGLTAVKGTGTSFDSSLVGKDILIVGLAEDPVEYTVAAVQSSVELTLTSPLLEDGGSGLTWYRADAAEVGFDGTATKTIDELLAKVDTTTSSRVSDRSNKIAERDEQALTLLQEDAGTSAEITPLRRYTLVATWDKPELVDLEEIIGYQVRVVELVNGVSEIPASVSVQTFNGSGSYAPLVRRTQDRGTPQRQRTEVLDAQDTVALGSTTQILKYTQTASAFRVNSRLVVNGESRIIRSVDPNARTIELNTPLSSLPAPGATIAAYRVAWEGDVSTERFHLEIAPGKRYAIALRSQSEYGLVSDWTQAIVIRTDDLVVSGGKTLADVALEETALRASLASVLRDHLTADWNEQLFSIQRVVAGTPSREEFATLQTAVVQIGANINQAS